MFYFTKNKKNYDDRSGHFTRCFFHWHAMISCVAKVMVLQSYLLLEKIAVQNHGSGVVQNTINIIAVPGVIRFVILPMIFNTGSLYSSCYLHISASLTVYPYSPIWTALSPRYLRYVSQIYLW